jgi:hypothetical protein
MAAGIVVDTSLASAAEPLPVFVDCAWAGIVEEEAILIGVFIVDSVDARRYLPPELPA